MNIYIYNSDRYGNSGKFATTFENFKAIVNEVFGGEGQIDFQETSDGIEDNEGQVAFLATSENLKDYEMNAQGLFMTIDDPENLIKSLSEIVLNLIEDDDVKGYTDIYDWIDEGGIDGMTPAEIANEWDELS